MHSLFPPVLAWALGTTELLIILFVLVLLFGAKKLPELAKGMGKSMKEFKKAANSDDEDDSEDKSAASRKSEAKSAKDA